MMRLARPLLTARAEGEVRLLGLLYVALSSHRRDLSVSGQSCYL
jgi:hypothetical protein